MRAEAEQAIALLRTQRHDTSITLGRVVSAATQVVAGTSDRFELEVTTAAGARHVTVVMYKNLHGARQLTDVQGLRTVVRRACARARRPR